MMSSHSAWISIWQGPEQDGIHNTEDRGGCAGTKTEGEDDYRCKPRIPTDLPKRIADILRQSLKPLVATQVR
jgi:hypothetical protein